MNVSRSAGKCEERQEKDGEHQRHQTQPEHHPWWEPLMSGQSAAKYAAAHAPHRMPLNAPQTACKDEQPHEKDEGHQRQQTPPEHALYAEKNVGPTRNPLTRKETLRQRHDDDHPR